MEAWRDGGMEGWRHGGMEGWRDGGGPASFVFGSEDVNEIAPAKAAQRSEVRGQRSKVRGQRDGDAKEHEKRLHVGPNGETPADNVNRTEGERNKRTRG
ncbi:hypothetical protein EYF80_065617 [Liparis tanakae]|uniref:Uncharacterized protein n=1 Tax=Liparis tanakae TaxID=230148 RepID=A0A4Z2E681_9TELE|nr:hypothetical protein EYF80_065617 [Liparis tanakae]